MTDMDQSSPEAAALAATDPRRISILGATGSIGCNTLDLIGRNRQAFTVEAVTANSNVELLAQQAREVGARAAVIGDPARYDELRRALSGSDIEVHAGEQALIEAATRPVDIVMASIMGAAGLRPTLEAVRQGACVALANKECLVCAGSLFMDEVRRCGATLLPVDSEHNAVFQVLDTDNRDAVVRVVLTASGGPFRTWTRAQMAKAVPEQALKHPNWTMGAKITIDSATLMNKGIELIEARYLFDLEPAELGVLVHPQSVVHSLVEYRDGSVLAQMGSPDMRIPIAYTLAWPRRMTTPSKRLDLAQIGALTFEAADEDRFPAIRLCRTCLESEASAATILNAANEVAVHAFLEGRIGFLEIAEVVGQCLDLAEKEGNIRQLNSLDDVAEVDRAARAAAQRMCA